MLEWGNLLPSCKKCNIKKDEHDVEAEPIVNPFVDNPKDFLYFSFYRYKAKNEIGQSTIKALGINHTDHFVLPRREVGNGIIATLEDLRENIDNIGSPKERKYIRKIKNLLERGNRKKEYAALTASTILQDDNFSFIEKVLKEKNLWDSELADLKEELIFCAL